MERENNLGYIASGMLVYDVRRALAGSVATYDQTQETLIIQDVPGQTGAVAVPRAQIISTDGGVVHLQLTLDALQHLHPTPAFAQNASNEFLSGLSHDIEQDTMREP